MTTPRLNADFEQRVVMPPPREEDWVDSPMPGVTRRMLDRVGGEVARATSLVRYAPGSQFARHEHGGGEEILVLEGLFRYEDGEYPQGSWLCNPRWRRHTPFTGPEGALIYVKVGHIGTETLVPDRTKRQAEGEHHFSARRAVARTLCPTARSCDRMKAASRIGCGTMICGLYAVRSVSSPNWAPITDAGSGKGRRATWLPAQYPASLANRFCPRHKIGRQVLGKNNGDGRFAIWPLGDT